MSTWIDTPFNHGRAVVQTRRYTDGSLAYRVVRIDGNPYKGGTVVLCGDYDTLDEATQVAREEGGK